MAVNSYKEDEQLQERSKIETMKRLFGYLLGYKWQVLVVLLMVGYGVVISLVNPIIMQKAIDEYVANKDFKGLYTVLGIALALNLLLVVFVKTRMYIMAKVCNDILLKIRQQLYTHIQTLDFKFFDSRPTGKILSRIIGDINSLKDVLSNCVTTFIPDAITLIAVIVIMFLKNPILAAAALISTPAMAYLLCLLEVKAHPRWQVFRKKSANVNAFVHEDLAGIRVIQSFGAEKESEETFAGLLKEHRDSFIRAVRLSDGFSAIIDLSWGIGAICMYFVGIVILGPDKVSVGTYVAFGVYIGMFWSPIFNLSNFYNQLVTNIAGAERIFEILDTPSTITDVEDAEPMPTIEGAVSFEHVTFSYDDETKVLDDVSFTVKPGETIALVGATGAGKSTIVNLISRFYDVQQGSVKIDGKEIKNVTLESLRCQMGIMTQDNFLFTGTIMDNIRYGRLDATDEEIVAAAKAVKAHDFIMKLENGYDTMLTERGGGLSIGQKQLLAFARTMVSKPAILILDEATSSIDTQTEKLVQQGIEELLRDRTSFVIAHRLSTIQKADRIFVIEDGRIIEEGNVTELLALKGAYYRLHMAQAI